MPALLRFLLRNALIGFSAAAMLVAAMVVTDTAGFGTVIRQSDIGLIAAALSVYFLGLTFSSVQIGIALMTGQATPDDDVRQRRPARPSAGRHR
ncbi:hypothetical protein [Jiella sonneratiae]|uniref:Multidrug resistance protein NorM n=1 Tax=Jiella sonneratiae TaxID=2816856 RepID=A0ABS3J2I9_9HYPH|nr:hypothetical protein [Jiella sonneratiae]MBO0903883.1 hypothetical protein [Jiella sonneratiae]